MDVLYQQHHELSFLQWSSDMVPREQYTVYKVLTSTENNSNKQLKEYTNYMLKFVQQKFYKFIFYRKSMKNHRMVMLLVNTSVQNLPVITHVVPPWWMKMKDWE